MKKLSIYIMAIASMGLAMTSCNKEEGTIPESITANIEENEILNDTKVHQSGEAFVYLWDEGDMVRFIDANNYAAKYKAARLAPRAHFDFVQNINSGRVFNPNNGPIVGIYPWNAGDNPGAFTMPKVQNSNSGEIYKHFPLYAEEPMSPDYEFKNLLGVAKSLLPLMSLLIAFLSLPIRLSMVTSPLTWLPVPTILRLSSPRLPAKTMAMVQRPTL